MNQPLVSVIVPVYNVAQYLPKCLDSIVNQTYRNLEIILVNDGSTDNSLEIIHEYAKKDSRIMVIDQENGGPSEARNNAIEQLNGQFILFVDSDDTIKPDYCVNLVDAIVKTNSDIVCCGYQDISKYGQVKVNDYNTKAYTLQKFINLALLGTGGVLWAKIFKAQIIQENRLRLDNKIFMSEDLVFVLEYILKCKEFYAINNNEYIYNRLNDNSISQSVSEKYLENTQRVCEQIASILNKANYNGREINTIISERAQTSVFAVIDAVISRESAQTAMKVLRNIIETDFFQRNSQYFVGKSLETKAKLALIKKNQLVALYIYIKVIIAAKKVHFKIKQMGG
ncbi:MAG: glycosyltransferase family 2 protein [Culicoidibacterales bacterium]